MKKINFSIEGVKFNIQVDDNDEISVDVALSDKCCNKPAQVISANGVSDLDSVAIATALSLYFNEEGCYEEEVHDEESGKLTIKTVDRRNSKKKKKIFGFYNL